MSFDAIEDRFLHIGLLRQAGGYEIDRCVVGKIFCGKMFFRFVVVAGFFHRNIDQSGLWTVRHGVPSVATERAWSERYALASFFVSRADVFDRTACRRVDARPPTDVGIGFGGNELSRGAIE